MLNERQQVHGHVHTVKYSGFGFNLHRKDWMQDEVQYECFDAILPFYFHLINA